MAQKELLRIRRLCRDNNWAVIFSLEINGLTIFRNARYGPFGCFKLNEKTYSVLEKFFKKGKYV